MKTPSYKVIFASFALVLGLIATAAWANGGGNPEDPRDRRCWETHVTKREIVFANLCTQQAWQTRIKELPPLERLYNAR